MALEELPDYLSWTVNLQRKLFNRCTGDSRRWSLLHVAFFFGMRGSHNDINVFNASPLLNKFAKVRFQVLVKYHICNTKITKPYFLADKIYPEPALFVEKTVSLSTKEESFSAIKQKGRRKNVERAFRVLQRKYHILKRDFRLQCKEWMATVVKCCVVIHDVMVEDRSDEIMERSFYDTGVVANDKVLFCSVGKGDIFVPKRGSIAAEC